MAFKKLFIVYTTVLYPFSLQEKHYRKIYRVTFYTNCKLLYFLLPFLFLLSLFRLHFFPHPSRSVLGAYPVSYTNGTGSFSEVKRSGRGANYSPPSNAKVKRISTIIEVPLCAFTPGYRIKYFYLSFPFP